MEMQEENVVAPMHPANTALPPSDENPAKPTVAKPHRRRLRALGVAAAFMIALAANGYAALLGVSGYLAIFGSGETSYGAVVAGVGVGLVGSATAVVGLVIVIMNRRRDWGYTALGVAILLPLTWWFLADPRALERPPPDLTPGTGTIGERGDHASLWSGPVQCEWPPDVAYRDVRVTGFDLPLPGNPELRIAAVRVGQEIDLRTGLLGGDTRTMGTFQMAWKNIAADGHSGTAILTERRPDVVITWDCEPHPGAPLDSPLDTYEWVPSPWPPQEAELHLTITDSGMTIAPTEIPAGPANFTVTIDRAGTMVPDDTAILRILGPLSAEQVELLERGDDAWSKDWSDAELGLVPGVVSRYWDLDPTGNVDLGGLTLGPGVYGWGVDTAQTGDDGKLHRHQDAVVTLSVK